MRQTLVVVRNTAVIIIAVGWLWTGEAATLDCGNCYIWVTRDGATSSEAWNNCQTASCEDACAGASWGGFDCEGYTLFCGEWDCGTPFQSPNPPTQGWSSTGLCECAPDPIPPRRP
jgi:hypothetical protein